MLACSPPWLFSWGHSSVQGRAEVCTDHTWLPHVPGESSWWAVTATPWGCETWSPWEKAGMDLVAAEWCSIHLAHFKSLQSVTGSPLSSTGKTSNFFIKDLLVVIRKNIQRSYLAWTSLQRMQTFISRKKREREELKTAMGSVGWEKWVKKHCFLKVTEEQSRPATKHWELSKGMRM